MPVQVDWYDKEETIKHWQFIGNWTSQEYLTLTENSAVRVEEKPYPVIVLFDFTASKTRAKNILNTFRNSERTSSDNIKLLIVIGNTFSTTLVNAFNRVGRNRDYPIVGVSSMEKALPLISEHQKTL